VKAVEFHPEAACEAEEAASYLERKREGLGRAFREELELALLRIIAGPERYPKFRNTEIRKVFLKRFSYTVYFLELETCIWVPAVAHQKRQEGYWLSRTPGDG
jgi:hypothetical protein